MTSNNMVNIYLYTRYERFWHWMQTALILLLLVTGFELNGLFTLFGFKAAAEIHNYSGLTWLILFAFFVFWLFTTGEWQQYVPTTRKMLSVIRYYTYGIFRGEPHPVPKRKDAKHNPLQRLAYLFVLVLINPLIWITGWFYLFYSSWSDWGVSWLSLEYVAMFHVIGAFMMLIFLIAHVYLATAGHTPTAHIKAMITGWEEVED